MAEQRVTLVKNDIWKMLEKQVRPEFISVKSWKMELYLLVDKGLYNKLDEDPILLQQVTDVGTSHYDKIVSSMRAALIDAEKDAAADWTDRNLSKLTRQLQADFDKLITASEERIHRDAMAVIEKWRKLNNDQLLSKFVLGVSVVSSLVGIGMHVATLASTPFTGGVGGVVGIVGLMRSISKLAGMFLDSIQDVDKLMNTLRKDLKDLATDFTDNNKKAKGADLAKEAFNALIFPANVVKSVNTLQRQLAVIGRKMRAMEIELHKLAKDINKGMVACHKAGKELGRIEKEISGNKDLEEPLKKATTLLDTCEKDLGNTIEKVISGLAGLQERLGDVAELTTLMDELAKMRGKPLKIIEGLLRFSTVLASLELSGAFKTVAETAAGTLGGAQALAALQSGPLKDVL